MIINRTRSMTGLLAASALILSSACSANNGESGTSSSASPSGSGAPVQSSAPAADTNPLGKYDPPIEVSVVGTTGTNVLFAEGENIDDNIMTQKYKEILGIQFKNKWVSDASQSVEKLNLAINTNNLPDISKVDLNQLSRMINQDQLADLTEAYETYASPLLRKALEYGGGAGFAPAKKDGKIYGMPVPNDYYENVAIMYIRKDWLDKLGLQPPKTIDELYEVATAFAERDPDGNGKADTYGIGLDNALGMAFDGVASAYKAYRATWVKDAGGQLVYGSVQPQMKDALAKLRELYASKAIDQEFGAKDWGKTADDIGAGKGGIYFGAFWQPLYPLQTTMTHTPDSDWNAYPIPAAADGSLVPKRPNNVFSWMVASKSMKHPEALIKSMNLWAEMWIEGGQYNDLFYKEIQGSEKYAGKEVHQYAKPYFFDDPGKNMVIGKQFKEAVAKDDGSLVTHPDGIWKWNAYKNKEPNGWAYYKYLLESEGVLAQYGESFVHESFLGAPTETMVKRQANLNKLEVETFTKIIMGKADLAAFDKFVSDWKSLGGDDITKEVNAWAAEQ
ncbi:extracellular solute-binding protein [Cohnella sp. REN36]|uniref:extracellular solute-binding protein n=1 Tax=Cohnella sp. REN36 TaxID=2887347 RepID=UPI001D14B98C|nr:extracellular solute-binding protein [Cohnella sp. REN36]MCC3372414.1 extracellular solute-binding protein [Cohnella sp. REN36]